MRRWVIYCIVFLLGGLSAFIINPSLVSRNRSTPLFRQLAILEGAASVSAIPANGETARVARVIDGDTIELTDKRRIRYIGVDTPELGDNRKHVECFAIEAMEENTRLVEGKTVRLMKDVSEIDKYGRLLRYVYIGDVFVQDHLVRQGFARIDTIPPDIANQQQFLNSGQEAQEQKRGLWNTCV